MKPVASTKLRAREVVFAVAMGVLGAGVAALILDDDGESAAGPAALAAPLQAAEVAPFEEISTVGPQDVVVVTGERYSVRAEGPQRAVARLEAVVEDGKLVIRPKGDFAGGFNWSGVSGATFYVTTPRLDAVSLAGSGNVRIDRVDGGRFTASIAGPGELAIAAMDIDQADFAIAGSGSIGAAGTARATRVSIMGSGEVEAGGLRSQTAEVSMAGSGDAELTVESEARISIMGSGDVNIEGPARCTISRMGSGEAHCDSDEE